MPARSVCVAPARKRREELPSSRPLLFSPVRAPLPVHTRMGALPSPHPVRTGREGQKGRRGTLCCPVRLCGAKGLGQGGGGVPFARRPTFPVCARRGGANPVREGRNRAPPTQGGAHRRGPRGKRGRGMQTVCVCIPHPLWTPALATLHTGGGARRQRVQEDGREEGCCQILPTCRIHLLFNGSHDLGT